jgi:hypothetical protein
LALLFTLFHVYVLLADGYFNFNVWQLSIPFLSPYRGWQTAAGVLALYALTLLIVSFYVRRYIGYRAWRALHFLTFALFAAATLHGITAGTAHRSVGEGALPRVRRSTWRSRCAASSIACRQLAVARCGRPRPFIPAATTLNLITQAAPLTTIGNQAPTSASAPVGNPMPAAFSFLATDRRSAAWAVADVSRHLARRHFQHLAAVPSHLGRSCRRLTAGRRAWRERQRGRREASARQRDAHKCSSWIDRTMSSATDWLFKRAAHLRRPGPYTSVRITVAPSGRTRIAFTGALSGQMRRMS